MALVYRATLSYRAAPLPDAEAQQWWRRRRPHVTAIGFVKV